ncbi:MAG: response regulator transcription factor [Burkholderiaceae bacterium]|nr:response regulator transcription factor [Burkholderiaceae bacterium]
MRILMVEDDAALGSSTTRGLELEGFTVDWRIDSNGAEAAMVSQRFDAIVLDLGLPGTSGEELLRDWRRTGNLTPVLVLTARGFILDRVRVLNLGADDYLVKPFDLLELSARLRALYRRQTSQNNVNLEFGALLLSHHEHTAVFNGSRVDLTKREHRILETFLRNRDRVLSRRQLEDALYGWGEVVESNAIEVHIHNLRRKLSRSLIQTVRGAGYRLNQDVNA